MKTSMMIRAILSALVLAFVASCATPTGPTVYAKGEHANPAKKARCEATAKRLADNAQSTTVTNQQVRGGVVGAGAGAALGGIGYGYGYGWSRLGGSPTSVLVGAALGAVAGVALASGNTQGVYDQAYKSCMADD